MKDLASESVRRILGMKRRIRETVSDDLHPERLGVLPYCSAGHGIDVGCGHRKTSDHCIGVDIVPKGEPGKHGCVKGNVSQADVCASGDDLPFDDGELDFVVARHNLEHYVDIIKTLLEWKRVLKSGGVMALVVPDERERDTIALDPTHKHCFTPQSLDRYIDLIGGLEKVESRVLVEKWSFLAVYRKR
jgi:ubiquinone/menaquinone biosynthesis C-methylase UbiE